jgi:hypothetical protein
MAEETKTECQEHPEHEENNECHDHHGHHHGHHGHRGSGMVLGPIWFIGWLFTIGYLHMPFFWKGVLALIVWPYYLGSALKPW